MKTTKNSNSLPFELLEERLALATDYGDAPDLNTGTGIGEYRTTLADGGPSHEIDERLSLGSWVDGDDGTLQGVNADADDLDGKRDEDGVVDMKQLQSFPGAEPTISISTKNWTGRQATLASWIDFNRDGRFSNTERVITNISSSRGGYVRYNVVFPRVPEGSEGLTYLRLRLSTDSAGMSSTGPASDGEVEDYPFLISIPEPAPIKVTNLEPLRDVVQRTDLVSYPEVAALGDLDGDGIGELAVSDSSLNSIRILFLNPDLTLNRSLTIGDEVFGAFPEETRPIFAPLGDFDQDGVPDLIVGSPAINEGIGKAFVFLLQTDGSLKQSFEIDPVMDLGLPSRSNIGFATSVSSAGDVDGDGITDVAIGSRFSGDSRSGTNGTVNLAFMNQDGTVREARVIEGLSYGSFGSSLAPLGDVDGDGVNDLAVGSPTDPYHLQREGAVQIVFLNSDGSVKQIHRIADDTTAQLLLKQEDLFGISLTAIGDIDKNGVTDLAVGAGDFFDRGIVRLFLLEEDGSLKSFLSLPEGSPLNGFSHFGGSLSSNGDLNGDGIVDLVATSRSEVFGDQGVTLQILSLESSAVEELSGDFNGDGVVDGLDISLLRDAVLAQDLTYDLDRNGQIDSEDLDFLVTNILGTNPGDANLDGVFDSSDLIQVFQFGEYEDGILGNSTWAEGDFNLDGEFDTGDLVAAFQSGSYRA